MARPTSPLERLRQTLVPPGSVAASWLGQAGFIVRGPAVTALIDPFLAPHEGRGYESGLAAHDAIDVDLVLSHSEMITQEVSAFRRRSPTW